MSFGCLLVFKLIHKFGIFKKKEAIRSTKDLFSSLRKDQQTTNLSPNEMFKKK